jgi:predicted secreted protein
MAKEDGQLIKLSFEGTQINGLVTQGLDLTTDSIECTTKDSNGVKEYLPGENGGTISCEGIIDDAATYSYSDLFAAWDAKTTGAFVYGGIVAGDLNYSGNAFITSLSRSDGKNEAKTWTATLQVTGTVAESTVV